MLRKANEVYKEQLLGGRLDEKRENYISNWSAANDRQIDEIGRQLTAVILEKEKQATAVIQEKEKQATAVILEKDKATAVILEKEKQATFEKQIALQKLRQQGKSAVVHRFVEILSAIREFGSPISAMIVL